ncbi:neuropilin-2-like [Acanthaster planci]|uniref:Neuropilin-2-like n=1 Tax=Acanthaster planci TaxID=133434 RepID=A0A8B7XVF2_ACAPL|nr:neuropilin-2-like [Acanthaster planci]
MVDTLRRRCSLTDVNQFYISLGDSEREDLYVMRDRVCDVFEDNGLTKEECLLPLGLEVGLITDGQLTASSYANLDHAPWEGRLNGNSSWMPDPAEFNQSAPADARPYLQIDFLERVKVTGLVVQGGGGADTLSGNWVEEFTVLIAHDPVGGAWDKVGLYKDTVSQYGPALPKIFEANKEPNCVRSMFFEEAIYTRYLQINPTQWHGQVALRLEVIGCRDTDCDNTLGMINGKITDSQIAVSSYRSLTEDGRAARLTPFNGRSGIGWIPAHSDPEPTVKIQLDRPHVLTSIITQGCVARGATSLRISHVNRTVVLSPVQDEISRLEIIGGNSGTSYLYRHTLLAPVTCTSVIITLLEPDELSCLKVELVGCLSLSGCRKRLGMETGRIADHQLSTQRNRSEAGQAATATPRLHQWVGLSSGWILGENGGGDWLQIDLLTLHTVSGVMVQAGRDHHGGQSE